jgi:hypothetical protein
VSNHIHSLVSTRKVGSPTKKAVLLHMADKAADNGAGVWASKQTIADELELDRSTVIRAINSMIGEGLLAKIGVKPCQNGNTTEYQIDIEAVAALELVACHVRKATSGTAPLVAQRHPTSGTVPPKPSINHPSPSGAKAPSVERAKTTFEAAHPDDKAVHAFRLICVQWAMKTLKWSAADAGIEFDRFVDSNIANGRRYANWERAWHNWCRSDFCGTAKRYETDTSYRKGPIRG